MDRVLEKLAYLEQRRMWALAVQDQNEEQEEELDSEEGQELDSEEILWTWQEQDFGRYRSLLESLVDPPHFAHSQLESLLDPSIGYHSQLESLLDPPHVSHSPRASLLEPCIRYHVRVFCWCN